MHDSYMQKVTGLASAFTLIFLSEIGDKTFILIVVYAGKMPFLLSVGISTIALGGMHVISTLVGITFTYLIS